MTETAKELVALKPPHSAEYWKMRHALVTASRDAALAREAGLRKTLEWVQHNGNFAHRDNIMSVVNNALEVKP